MKENISYLHNEIKIEELGEKLGDFLYGLEQIINQGKNKDIIDEKIAIFKTTGKPQIIDFNKIERIYMKNGFVYYFPNTKYKAKDFVIVVEHYNKVKELLFNQENNF